MNLLVVEGTPITGKLKKVNDVRCLIGKGMEEGSAPLLTIENDVIDFITEWRLLQRAQLEWAIFGSHDEERADWPSARSTCEEVAHGVGAPDKIALELRQGYPALVHELH